MEDLKEAVLFILGVLATAEVVEVIGADGSDSLTDYVVDNSEQVAALELIDKIKKSTSEGG